ncbi:NlpC/P60 family protein [uncultured Clostridium sp.]|uniref:C40 family peptidase n=1 Tax=uncultured Clostridium sp. TaxID=59620 RepID=UPI003217B42B
MNKKSISLVLALALSISCIGTSAFADPNSDRSTYEQKLEENKNNYKSAQEQVDEIEASIQSVNSQMEDISIDIEELNAEILEAEGKIKESNKKVQATESDIKDQNEVFSQRMRAMYINGMGSYAEALLNSKSVSDFMSTLSNVNIIINSDKEIVSGLNEKKETLVKEKKVVEDEKVKLDALQEENNKKLAQLEEKRAEHKEALAKAEANRDLFDAAVKENEAQLEETKRQISQYVSNGTSTSSNRPSRGGSGDSSVVAPPNASGSSIVGYAYKFLGVPYQWGGNGPNTFDCSGLTKYVYAACGISLPRVAQDQMNAGTPVSQPEPGDLVFFGTSGNIYHVGIYVGNNSYLHAPQDNEVVKISPMTRGDYAGARRY